jgi:hypothetical protein
VGRLQSESFGEGGEGDMTAQFSDPVKYRGKSYSLAGKNGTRLFDPAAHGLKPVGKCSACWRGFVCTYAVRDRKLLLDALAVCLDAPAPALFGVAPKPDEGGARLFDAVYEGLAHPMAYSGGLLLAAGFIEGLYVHMGFHPAWKYREVHELVFRDGELVQEADRSEQIAEFRRELRDRPLEPGRGARRADVKRWIERCFSQEYRW